MTELYKLSGPGANKYLTTRSNVYVFPKIAVIVFFQQRMSRDPTYAPIKDLLNKDTEHNKVWGCSVKVIMHDTLLMY